jgi:enolase
MRIEELHLREAIDSDTQPAAEVEINGFMGKTSAASSEDQEKKRHLPEHLKEIEKLLKQNFEKRDLTQEEFDQELKNIDGSEDFSRLGSTATASSLAFKNASGFEHGKRFPMPLANIASRPEPEKEDFFILPVKSKTFPEALNTCISIYQELEQQVEGNAISTGGTLITDTSSEEILEILKDIADRHEARLGVDLKASKRFKNQKYRMESFGEVNSSKQQVEWVQDLIDRYELAYIEDAFHDEDFRNHALIEKKNPDALISGNALFRSNRERLREGIDNESCNSITLNLRKTGTITDARKTIELAKENNYTPIISQKKRETPSTITSDLAMEWNLPIIKTGIAGTHTPTTNKLLRHWKNKKEPELSY